MYNFIRDYQNVFQSGCTTLTPADKLKGYLLPQILTKIGYD